MQIFFVVVFNLKCRFVLISAISINENYVFNSLVYILILVNNNNNTMNLYYFLEYLIFIIFINNTLWKINELQMFHVEF